jgi:sugar transferase (PEP-CTERM/EpsH1 system associated)
MRSRVDAADVERDRDDFAAGGAAGDGMSGSMNVLWLNSGLLLPLDKGGKLRTWHLMRHLARRHDITYVSFADADGPPSMREGMREVCSRLATVPRTDPAKGTARFYLDAARYVVHPTPYAVAKYRSSAYQELIATFLAGRPFDVIVCDFLPPVVNMPERFPCPAVLFTHNVESEIWRRHADTAGDPVSRTLLKAQWRRMLAFERQALSRFDLVLAVSDADRRTFERIYPGALRSPAHVVQTGVDTGYFVPQTGSPGRAHLVFTGSMDWLANEDAMVYFVSDILPRIRQAEPGTTLSIVGRAPTPAVVRLAQQHGVAVTGRVEDVRPHIAEAAVYVVPLRIGGGTRLKIFEAMAMAKAVVSTSIGAEGLPVTHGRDILMADTPAQFADTVVGLIRDQPARRRIETAARQLVVERYDWSVVAQDLEDALLRIGTASREAVA